MERDEHLLRVNLSHMSMIQNAIHKLRQEPKYDAKKMNSLLSDLYVDKGVVSYHRYMIIQEFCGSDLPVKYRDASALSVPTRISAFKLLRTLSYYQHEMLNVFNSNHTPQQLNLEKIRVRAAQVRCIKAGLSRDVCSSPTAVDDFIKHFDDHLVELLNG